MILSHLRAASPEQRDAWATGFLSIDTLPGRCLHQDPDDIHASPLDFEQGVLDRSFDTLNAEDTPRGLSDYVGNAGYHPDHTPVDVFMDNHDVGLSVGYAMLADGDDSYA